jgi:hypothetical protein
MPPTGWRKKALGWGLGLIFKFAICFLIIAWDVYEPSQASIVDSGIAGLSTGVIFVVVNDDAKNAKLGRANFNRINFSFVEPPISDDRKISLHASRDVYQFTHHRRSGIEMFSQNIDIYARQNDCCFSLSNICDFDNRPNLIVGQKWRQWSDPPDPQFWSMGGNILGACQQNLHPVERAENDCRDGHNASENHKPVSVASNSFIWPLLMGVGIGLVGIFGGAAVLWRLWGV